MERNGDPVGRILVHNLHAAAACIPVSLPGIGSADALIGAAIVARHIGIELLKGRPATPLPQISYQRIDRFRRRIDSDVPFDAKLIRLSESIGKKRKNEGRN